jgi:hypothetical protein
VNAFFRISRLALPALVLVCGACGGGEAETTGKSGNGVATVFQRSGPLSAVLITDTPMDGPRSAAEPRIALTSAQTSVYGMVLLADEVAERSTLTFSWYRVNGDGSRRALFTHDIAAPRGGGGAVSQGLAPEGLVPGIYETVVALGEHRVRSPWFVTAAPSRSLSAASQDATGPELAAGATDSWGDEDVDPIWGPDEPPGPCTLVSLDAFAFFVYLAAELDWAGTCETVSLAAAATGTPRTFDSIDDPGTSTGSLQMEELFCLVPGGSDLPGTVFRVVGSASGVAPKEFRLTLPDLKEEFAVQYESVPAVGARVRPGDVIRINAQAARLGPALGIKVLYLDDGSRLIASTGNVAGTTEPVPCRPGQHGAVLRESTYRVPDDPPALIEICAYSEGFDAEKREHCGSFPTGETEVWQGTWDGGFHVPPPCTPPVWDADGTVSFTVAADGTLSGAAAITNEPGTCGGHGSPPPAAAGGALTGRRTAEGFDLQVVLPGAGQRTIPLVRDGNDATGELSVPLGAGARYEVDLALRCTTCG